MIKKHKKSKVLLDDYEKQFPGLKCRISDVKMKEAIEKPL